jgi:hypothetical protein
LASRREGKGRSRWTLGRIGNGPCSETHKRPGLGAKLGRVATSCRCSSLRSPVFCGRRCFLSVFRRPVCLSCPGCLRPASFPLCLPSTLSCPVLDRSCSSSIFSYSCLFVPAHHHYWTMQLRNCLQVRSKVR